VTGAGEPSARADEMFLGRWRPGRRGLLLTVLVAAVAAAAARVGLGGHGFHGGGAAVLWTVVRGLVELELSPDFLAGKLLPAAGVTVAYAVAAMSVALLVGIPGAIVGSGVLQRRRTSRVVVSTTTRAALGALRGADELIWALLLVFVFGLSPWAGVLGIGLPYGAIVGRVLADRLQDVPVEPTQALRAAGASETQILLYCRLPHALADASSYLMYRFECAVRTAAVLSFVGLGGLGLELTIALDDLEFGRAWTVLLALVGLVLMIGRLSHALRRRILA
jgi:phosphonate transport system permease protein